MFAIINYVKERCMRYPEFLKDKDTIGFVAPSMGCATEPYKSAFDNAQMKFKKLGYSIDIGPNAYAQDGIGISSTPQLCAQELNDAYCGTQNDIIISCGGGELMCEVVPYIDFERIKKSEPKWYMGYSDNTNFTFLSATISDTASVYGPCAAAFGMEPWHKSLQDSLDVLSGKTSVITNYDRWEKESLKSEDAPLTPYNVTEPFSPRSIPDEDINMSGRLIGGCLDCLVNLVGTKFDHTVEFSEKYKDDGIIWFLESCELNVMSIRRALWQIKNAGWFEHTKGFLFGRSCCMDEEEFGINQYQAIEAMLSEFKVPIIMDLDIGHQAPMMPVVCGGTVEVFKKGKSLTMKYTWK